MFIIACAGLFSFLITRAGIPASIGMYLTEILQSPFEFLLGGNVALFIIGMFIETSAAFIVLAPFLVSICIQFGVDPVDRKSTRLNSSHYCAYRMPSFAC